MKKTFTAEDLRYAKAIDLERVTGIHSTAFSAWSSDRAISEKNIIVIAKALGISKSEALRGLDLRRQDNKRCRKVAQMLESLRFPATELA